jgi:hypothetical protein
MGSTVEDILPKPVYTTSPYIPASLGWFSNQEWSEIRQMAHKDLGWTSVTAGRYLAVSIYRDPTLAEQSLRPGGRSIEGSARRIGGLTRDPHLFSAHHTYLPNLKRVRHSSTLNSNTSFSSSAEERHSRFCWNNTITAARAVRGFNDVSWTICPRLRRPRASRAEATVCWASQVRVPECMVIA